ncbi:hypothetical protein AB0I51_03830 [Streptomyces sp. NPDC050549]|uniref:hypothetical protein n=1 Tax=Streptomyces sp. NPDC050549 TaxID=3155406 RepID=UPI00343E8837
MSPRVLAGVPRGTWQIKKAVVRHSGCRRAARAPPSSARSTTRASNNTPSLQEIKHT